MRTLLYIALVACVCAAYATATSEPRSWGDTAIYRDAVVQTGRVERSASAAAPLRSRQYHDFYRRSAPQYGGYYGGMLGFPGSMGFPMIYRSSDADERPARVERSASAAAPLGGGFSGHYRRSAPQYDYIPRYFTRSSDADEQPARVERSASAAAPLGGGFSGHYGRSAPQDWDLLSKFGNPYKG